MDGGEGGAREEDVGESELGEVGWGEEGGEEVRQERDAGHYEVGAGC